MVIQPNNLNNLVFDPGPLGLGSSGSRPSQDLIASANASDKVIESDSERSRAARLAETGASSRPTAARETNNKLQGLNVIEGLWNLGKKFGRNVCLVGGWASASAAVVSLLFLNIKVLAIIFGVPALLFLYSAASLGRDIKADPMSGPVKDPLNGLRKILQDHPEILRNDPKFVVRTIQAVGEMKKNTPRYYEVLDRVEALRETVLMEMAQLRNKEDERSLLYKELMEDYLSEIGKLANQSPVHDPLQAMHSAT